MLSPKYLYYICDNIVNIYDELNQWCVNDICRRLVNSKFLMTGSAEYQIRKIQQSGMLLEDVIKKVASVTRKSKKEVAKMFEDACITSLKYDNKVYLDAGLFPIPLMQSPQMLSILIDSVENTNKQLRNFTRTTAIETQRLFIKQLDRVYYQVISGERDYNSAIAEAVNNVSKDGIWINYPSGSKTSIEAAVRRCIVTGVNQCAGRISLQNMEQVGVDLVLVSSHLSARPTHQVWQGKVYHVDIKALDKVLKRGKYIDSSVKDKLNDIVKGADGLSSTNTKKYPDFISSTGYGTGAGLCGWNCRHSFGPYIEGISTNPFKDYDSEENKKIYDLTQEQRAKERAIRNTKRQLNGIDAAKSQALKNNNKELADKLDKEYIRLAKSLKHKRQDYSLFCKRNKLKTQNERTQIAGFSRAQARKAVLAAKE